MTKEYPLERKAWDCMKQRCYNKNNCKYDRYGGRGIKVCSRWINNYDLFLQDMGRKPSPDMSLERFDLDGDYTPENCIWATPKTQANNRSTNHSITFNGETKNITEWAIELGINHQTLCQRIHVYGWSADKALSTPVRKRG